MKGGIDRGRKMESGGEGGSVGGTVRSAETEESGVVKETRRVDSFRADEFASSRL